MGSLFGLEVGCGDTSIIATDRGTVLVDCYQVDQHLNRLPSRRLDAVFVTHQHYDHFLGLESLASRGYAITYLICSPYERRYDDKSVEYDEWQRFEKIAAYFEALGTKVLRPYRQDDLRKPWGSVAGLDFYIVGPAPHIARGNTRELHDASLVFLAQMGSRRCLFTGDASDKSLNWIAGNTSNYCNDLLHASHHGSINGADSDFVKGARAVETVISTKSGVHDNVPHPTALRRYRETTQKQVYRTDVDGTRRFDF